IRVDRSKAVFCCPSLPRPYKRLATTKAAGARTTMPRPFPPPRRLKSLSPPNRQSPLQSRPCPPSPPFRPNLRCLLSQPFRQRTRPFPPRSPNRQPRFPSVHQSRTTTNGIRIPHQPRQPRRVAQRFLRRSLQRCSAGDLRQRLLTTTTGAATTA